jgi:hypothetical protein
MECQRAETKGSSHPEAACLYPVPLSQDEEFWVYTQKNRVSIATLQLLKTFRRTRISARSIFSMMKTRCASPNDLHGSLRAYVATPLSIQHETCRCSVAFRQNIQLCGPDANSLLAWSEDYVGLGPMCPSPGARRSTDDAESGRTAATAILVPSR